MEDLIKRLIEKYDALINELEAAYIEDQVFINVASKGNVYSQLEVNNRMALARDNKRRLDFAIAERNLLRSNL